MPRGSTGSTNFRGRGRSSPDSSAVSSIPQTSGKLSWKPCPTLTPPLVPPPLHRSVSARNIRGWQPEVPAPLPSRFLRGGGGPEPGPPSSPLVLFYFGTGVDSEGNRQGGAATRLLPARGGLEGGARRRQRPNRVVPPPAPRPRRPVPAQPASAWNVERCHRRLSRGPHARPAGSRRSEPHCVRFHCL